MTSAPPKFVVNTLDESTIKKSSFHSQQARTWNSEELTALTAVPH